MLHVPCEHTLVAYDFRKPFKTDFGKLHRLAEKARVKETILFENVKLEDLYNQYNDGNLPPFIKAFTFDIDRYRLSRINKLKRTESTNKLYDFKMRNKVIRGTSVVAFDRNLGIVTKLSPENAKGAWVPLPLELDTGEPELYGTFIEGWYLANEVTNSSKKKDWDDAVVTTKRMAMHEDVLAHSYDYRLGYFSGLFNLWGNLPLGGDGARHPGEHDPLSRPKFKCVQKNIDFWFRFRQLAASLAQETNDKIDHGYTMYYVTRLRPTSFFPLIDKLRVTNPQRKKELERFKEVYHSSKEGGRRVPLPRAVSETLAFYKSQLKGDEDQLTRKYSTKLLEEDLHIADKNLAYVDNWRRYMVNNKKIHWLKIDEVVPVDADGQSVNFLITMQSFLSSYMLPQAGV